MSNLYSIIDSKETQEGTFVIREHNNGITSPGYTLDRKVSSLGEVGYRNLRRVSYTAEGLGFLKGLLAAGVFYEG